MSNPQRSKLQSANLLIFGIESLMRCGVVTPDATKDAGMFEAANDRRILGHALTCVVLYAIVVELVVKHVWEQKHNETAKHDHNVHRLFKQLPRETQSEIEALYDECCRAHQGEHRRAHQDASRAGLKLPDETVNLASLEEALQWNAGAMRDFKYELSPQSSSMPAGFVMYSTGLLIPRDPLPNFAVILTRWAARQSFEKPLP